MTTAKTSNIVVLQARDYTLLRGLFESRIMTVAHIAILHFGGKREAAKKRLQKIKAAGFINERKRRVNEPSVLFLTRKGFSFLAGKNLLSEFPRLSASVFEKRANVSDLTLRHELEVMDVKAAFHTALSNSGMFSIAEFCTWPRLHEFKARSGSSGREVLVKPDGFIRIQEKEKDGGLSEHTFFLEVDRSTESQATLISRVGCYLDYYKSGSFAVANGASKSDYKEFPFRVLIVLKTAERRNNTAERLLQSTPPILTLAHVTTFEEVTKNPLDVIWMRPTDYRDAVNASDFRSEAQTAIYRRRPARENFVEDLVRKIPLLESQQSS